MGCYRFIAGAHLQCRPTGRKERNTSFLVFNNIYTVRPFVHATSYPESSIYWPQPNGVFLVFLSFPPEMAEICCSNVAQHLWHVQMTMAIAYPSGRWSGSGRIDKVILYEGSSVNRWWSGIYLIFKLKLLTIWLQTFKHK